MRAEVCTRVRLPGGRTRARYGKALTLYIVIDRKGFNDMSIYIDTRTHVHTLDLNSYLGAGTCTRGLNTPVHTYTLWGDAHV